MQRFMMKPSIDMIPGIKVSKDTEFVYENENTKQTLSNLIFHSVTKTSGEIFESTCDTTIYLREGDVLLFEDEGRGWIKPVSDYVTVKEAIEELKCIKDM